MRMKKSDNDTATQDPEWIEALEESIKRWESFPTRIVVVERSLRISGLQRLSYKDCALCRYFGVKERGDTHKCKGACPLKQCGPDSPINGISYALESGNLPDVLGAIQKVVSVMKAELEKEKAKPETPFHSRGDRFRNLKTGGILMLCQVGPMKYCLINISSNSPFGPGNRERDPINTNSHHITDKELSRIADVKDWRDKLAKVETETEEDKCQ